jgi:hypothetical protein
MPRRLAVMLAVALAALPARAVDQGVTIESWADAYPRGEPDLQSWFRFTYTLNAQLHPKIFVKLAALVERDSHGEISRDVLYDFDDRDLKRAATRFREVAIGFRAAGTTVTIGRQRLTWARTSFVNATDNLIPRDWTDPLDEVRLARPAVDAVWERDRWYVEAAVVPQYAPSRLPQLGSRWFPTSPGTDVTWGTADFPPVTWGTLQAAARGGYRGSDGEITLSYFRGYDDAERLIPRIGLPDPGTGIIPVSLDRRFPELEVAGVDGEVLLGAWVFRGEAGYFHYPQGLDDGYGLYQVEAEWSRAAWRVIAGFGDTVGGSAFAVAATALDVASLPALFLSTTYGETTEWQVALDAVVGTNDWDSYVSLSGSYPFAGHVRVGGELDLIGGAPGTFWGRWRENDRLRAFLKFDF